MAHRERTARRQGPPRRSKLNSDRDLLLGLVRYEASAHRVKGRPSLVRWRWRPRPRNPGMGSSVVSEVVSVAFIQS